MTKSSIKSSLKFDAAVGRIYGPVWSRMLQITQSDLAEWPGNENVLTTDILQSSFRILLKADVAIILGSTSKYAHFYSIALYEMVFLDFRKTWNLK